jgi:uncharacterized protein DUF2017
MARIRRYLGRVELWFDDRERAALLHAVDVLSADVVPATADAAPASAARLRPRVYEDAKLEAEFQRYTAPEVTALHSADIDAIRSDLGGGTAPLRLDEDRAMLWLRTLNVLRVAAGGRLGIEDDGWEETATVEAGAEETWAMFMDLGWVQEGILSAMES